MLGDAFFRKGEGGGCLTASNWGKQVLLDFILESEVREHLKESMAEREGSGSCQRGHQQSCLPLRRKTLLSNH